MARTQPFVVSVSDVCFCHWPVPARPLGQSVPDWLTVETTSDSAWLTAIPHTVSEVTAFDLELTRPTEVVTVRTYVRDSSGQRGLYFFAVIPSDPITSAAATPVLGLPTIDGSPKRYRDGEEGTTRRTLDIWGQRVLDVMFQHPSEEPTTAPPDSVASFLVERHRYFTDGPLGSRLTGNVGRDPWHISPVETSVSVSLTDALDLPDPLGDPVCHYSPGADLSVAPPRPVWMD